MQELQEITVKKKIPDRTKIFGSKKREHVQGKRMYGSPL